MTLDHARAQIDAIDPQIRDLLMQRLDCACEVVEAKLAAGETTVFRADREEEVLKKLGDGVPDDRLPEYLAVVRKIMETGRMYQYGLMYDRLDQPLFGIIEEDKIPAVCTRVLVRLTRKNRPNAMSEILSMIGDYGYNMEQMTMVGEDLANQTVTFDLLIQGDLNETHMKKLIFQLSKESTDFRLRGFLFN